MDWRDHIYSNPNIGGGKPIFRDSRFKVEFVLELMGGGWTFERMVEEYPGLRPEFLPAAAAFAADLMRDGDYVAISQARTLEASAGRPYRYRHKSDADRAGSRCPSGIG